MFLTLLRLEFLKLRGTLASAVCLLAPLIVAVFALAIALRQNQLQWRLLGINALGLWTYFVLPMTIAALAALIAQIEHAPRAWDHLFALPVSRVRVIIAKAVMLMILIAAETAGLLLLVLLLGVLAGLDASAFPWSALGALAAMTWLAAALMAVIQLWVALAVRSFVAPVGLGLAGTFAVVAAMGGPVSAVLPWGMPLATLPVQGGSPLPALLTGFLGGMLLVPVAAMHLSRREF